MITTLAKVKEIYNVSVDTYNDQITEQIETITESITEYCNNNFISRSNAYFGNIYTLYNDLNAYACGLCVFDSSDNSITASTSLFEDFQAGDTIKIENSIRNNGYFTISTVSNMILTIEEDLSDETRTIYAYLVIFPKGLSLIAARMVGYDVLPKYRNRANGLKSQNIGTWSGTYRDIKGNGYPEDIIGGLSSYKYHGSK